MFVMLLNTVLEATRVCSNRRSVRNDAAEHSWCSNKNLRRNNTVRSRGGGGSKMQCSYPVILTFKILEQILQLIYHVVPLLSQTGRNRITGKESVVECRPNTE